MKKIYFLIIVLVNLNVYSQNCCNNGYKNFLIVTKNGVEIGFKIQKTTNNQRGETNVYSVVAYAQNTTNEQLFNQIPAVFKIVGVSKVNIPGVKTVMNVRLGDALPPNSGIIREEVLISLQEPRLELDGFIQGIWKKR